MDLYAKVCARLSRSMTEHYSTSFTSASRLFPEDIRSQIYGIYGLVRLADEVVDSYRGNDSITLLNDLENETYAAIDRGFSTNPIVHAFAATANSAFIDWELIGPFFDSMRMDVQPVAFDESRYRQYIYGSAEVIGLMCLKVFCGPDKVLYTKLAPGARRLGAAYQKINFLRDLRDDYQELGRMYFPDTTFEDFDEAAKKRIISDIRKDLKATDEYIRQLPPDVRPAVAASYRYYEKLVDKLAATPAATIKQRRIRLSDHQKALLLAPYLLRARR